jgi:hypothetical protein
MILTNCFINVSTNITALRDLYSKSVHDLKQDVPAGGKRREGVNAQSGDQPSLTCPMQSLPFYQPR